MRTPTRRAVALLACSLALAACSAAEDDTTPVAAPVLEDAATNDDTESAAAPTAGSSDEEAALEFAGCMRDEGIDFPDPTLAADGSVDFGFGPGSGPPPFDPDAPAFQDALDVCSPLVEGASFLPSDGDLVQLEDTLLEVAACLRDQGIDVDDPDLSQGLAGPEAIFGEGFDPEDPATADAIDACAAVFGGLPGPGGS